MSQRERDVGTSEHLPPRDGSNGFVNRRSPVQSGAPAQGSENTEIVEEWRPIPGVESWYEASSLGRVRRLHGAGKSSKPPTVLRATETGSNPARPYLAVGLSVAGVSMTRSVHRLVAETFLGVRPAGLEVNHIDGDKQNNAASNLEYVTRTENMRHAQRIGIWSNYRGVSHCRKCGATGHNIATCGRPADWKRPAYKSASTGARFKVVGWTGSAK